VSRKPDLNFQKKVFCLKKQASRFFEEMGFKTTSDAVPLGTTSLEFKPSSSGLVSGC
jgi:N-acetylglutamate synthase-like GNAT family acetyltransferase